jgi:hypothetical protein
MLYVGGTNTEKPAEIPLSLSQGLLTLLQRKMRVKFLTPIGICLARFR